MPGTVYCRSGALNVDLGRPYLKMTLQCFTAPTPSQQSLKRLAVKSGLPYRIFGSMKFYERKEVKDVVAYLTALTNKEDSLRLARIINEPKRGIGDSTVNPCADCSRRGCNPYPKSLQRRAATPTCRELLES